MGIILDDIKTLLFLLGYFIAFIIAIFLLPLIWFLIPIGIVISIISKTSDFFNSLNESEELCPHGIENGISGKCEQCLEEQKEEKRKLKIKKEAKKLKDKEMKRLSKLLLKNEKFLLSLSSKEFEDEITDLFKEKGFELEQTSYVNDGGKDAVGFKNNKKYLFEYKQYGKGSIVGRPDIQKFHSAIVEEEADKGYFITISRFSKPAVNLANKFGIRLIEGTELLRMFEEVYPTDLAEEAFKVMCLECGEIVKFENIESNRSSKCKNGHIVECNISKPNFKIRTSPENKICKLCGSKMQKRKGSYGKFWGCSNYPRCNYTESIR